MRDSTVERVPSSATRFRPRALTSCATSDTMSINGMRSSGSSCCGADMRRDRHDRRHLGATRRRAVDEAVQVAGKLIELVGLGERARMIDVGVRDQHARDAALRVMRGDQSAIVMNGRARPEPADQVRECVLPCS